MKLHLSSCLNLTCSIYSVLQPLHQLWLLLVLPSLDSPSSFDGCRYEGVKLFPLSSFFFKSRLMGPEVGAPSTFCNSPPGFFAPRQVSVGQPARQMEILQRGSWKYAVTHLLFPSCVAQFSDLLQSRSF